MIDENGQILEDVKVEKIVKNGNFTFSSADIPMGAEIKFTRDDKKTAKVISEKKLNIMVKNILYLA
mgnify:CR=1 FL=1